MLPKKVEKTQVVETAQLQKEDDSRLTFYSGGGASSVSSSVLGSQNIIVGPPTTPQLDKKSSTRTTTKGSSKSAISRRLTYSSLTDFSTVASYSTSHAKHERGASERYEEEEDVEEEKIKKEEPRITQTRHGLFIDSPTPPETELDEDTDAHQKVKMYYRKPVFLPTSKKYLYRYEKQMSYFSEEIAKDQRYVQRITDYMYNQKCGRYRACEAKLIEKLPQPEPLVSVTSMDFTKCRQYLGIGYACGVFKVMDLDKLILLSPLPEGRRSKILCVRSFPRDLMFVGSTSRGIILVCKYEKPLWRTWEYGQETNNELNAFDFNASGTRLVTGGQDCTLRVYDFHAGKILNEYTRYNMDSDRLIQLYDLGLEDQEDGHYRRIHAIKFIDGDENIFLSGGEDNTVKIWDIRIPDRSVQNIYGPHICGDALDVLDNKILTGQWTHCRSLEVWDLRTSAKIQTLMPKNRGQLLTNEFTYCCKFLRSWDKTSIEKAHGDLVTAGGSGYGALEILSLGYNSILHRFLEPGHIVTIAQAEDFIAYGTTSNVLGICAFYPKRTSDEPDILQETYEQLHEWTEKHGLDIDKYVKEEKKERNIQRTETEDIKSSSSISLSSAVKEEQNDEEEAKKVDDEEKSESQDYALDFIETTKIIDDEDESYIDRNILGETLKELSASDYGDSDSTDYNQYPHSQSSMNSFFKFPLDAEFLQCLSKKDDEKLFPQNKKFKQKQMRRKKLELLKHGKQK